MTQMHFKFNTHKWIEEKKEKQATKALKHDLLTVGITTIQMHSKIWKCSFFVLTINFEWIKSPHNDNNTTQTNFKNNSLNTHACVSWCITFWYCANERQTKSDITKSLVNERVIHLIH